MKTINLSFSSLIRLLSDLIGLSSACRLDLLFFSTREVN